MPTTASNSSPSPKAAAETASEPTAAAPAVAPSQGRKRKVVAARASTATTTAKVEKGSAKADKGKATDPWLAKQQEALLDERATYTQQAEELKAEADQLAAEMEPGDTQFDDESGEGGTQQLDRERDLALSAQARAAVEEIDRALEKIGNGTYGSCERCGKAIPKPRLEAIPWAALCVQCKSGGLSARR